MFQRFFVYCAAELLNRVEDILAKMSVLGIERRQQFLQCWFCLGITVQAKTQRAIARIVLKSVEQDRQNARIVDPERREQKCDFSCFVLFERVVQLYQRLQRLLPDRIERVDKRVGNSFRVAADVLDVDRELLRASSKIGARRAVPRRDEWVCLPAPLRRIGRCPLRFWKGRPQERAGGGGQSRFGPGSPPAIARRRYAREN